MLEHLAGVDIRHEKGDQISLSNVLKAYVKLYFDKSSDTATVTLNGTEITVGPDQLPPGFRLTSMTPPYTVEAELSALTMKIDGNAEVLAWVVKDPKAMRENLMTLFGVDSIANLLGAVNTNLRNLNAEAVVIDERW